MDKNEESLFKAVGSSNFKKVKQVLTQSVNVNVTDRWGYTPLIRACVYGDIDIAEVLIARGAEVNARTEDGNTALFEASLSQEKKPLAELLIEKGAYIDIKNKHGDTPLIMATMNGIKEIVELLIAKGADVNATNNMGSNVLSVAWTHGQKEIMRLLYDNGARDNSIIGFGDSH
jgi:ankyrin repeat protein